jgi:HK97 gp10 family phage protein
MAVEMKTTGMEEISEMLQQMEKAAPGVANRALYVGAGIMAEEINREAAGIEASHDWYAVNGYMRLPTEEEKAAVLSVGVGVAKFEKNGTESNTSVGYSNAGYATVRGKKKAIPLIANAINSGTSFMNKQPFFRKAVNSGSKKAIQAMKEAVEADFNAMTK